MRYAIERDGVVINVIVANSAEIADLIAAQEGDTARLLADWELVEFAPQPSVPLDLSNATINRHQAKIVLLRHGLLDVVDAIIANGTAEMQLAWKEAPQFRRNSPTLLEMAIALELTDAHVDALFAEAMQVDV